MKIELCLFNPLLRLFNSIEKLCLEFLYRVLVENQTKSKTCLIGYKFFILIHRISLFVSRVKRAYLS